LQNTVENHFLLSHRFKIAGYLLSVSGIVLAITRYYFEVKLGFFNTKVFALSSSYLETNYFTVIDNHISEEVAAVLILVGLFLLAFSKERVEHDKLSHLRFKSFLISFYTHTGLLICSVIFIYGFGFLKILVLNLFAPLVFYNVIFRFQIYKNK
jgi:hypothetical protein